jgi:beta-glucosidase
VEAKAHSVMPAYNRTNGEPCCSSQRLLVDILREEWGFQGYVVSDCWAIRDFHENHKVTKTPEESAADAVKAGCDLNCGCTYEHIPQAVEQGLLEERDLDLCVSRLFRARMLLGMFDPPERVPHASIPYEVNDNDEHRKLARTAAKKAMVLLKNDGVLPLSRDLKSIAMIGPNASDDQVLVANYFGIPSAPVTPLEGIRNAVSENTKVWYAPGCKLLGTKHSGLGASGNLSEAKSLAERADAVVLCIGLSADIEGEQGDAGNSDAGGDKNDLNLTGLQRELLEMILDVGKPTVVVVLSGSALNLSAAQARASAVLQAWYPGEEAGNALADVLFGESPGGRLPITFPKTIEDVPEFTNYSMVGRTYRYLEKEPLYPFGYGLSYSRFEYNQIEVSSRKLEPGEPVKVSATVKNTGKVTADEVAQLYVSDLEASCRVPVHNLRGFRRVTLSPEESTVVEFELTPRDLSLIDESGRRRLEPGRFRATIGGSQPDRRSTELTGQSPLAIEFEVVGRSVDLPY